MEFTQYILPNGIRCIHKQVRSNVAYTAMTINAGSRDELKGEYGMAHMLEHMLFKGTKKRQAYHINCRLENLGGELNAFTTKEETVIHATTLKGDFGKATELIADIVFNSVFPQDEIERERGVILEEINSYKDSVPEIIFDDFEDMLFEERALGHNSLGDKKTLKKFDKEKILTFRNRCYNTDQMVFSVIGNISPDRFRAACDKYLSDIPASPRSFTRVEDKEYEPFNKKVRKPNCQAHCLLGNRAYSFNDPKRTTLAVLTNILGGPANSLLNIALRERNGLTYNIEAGYTPFSDTGVASIYFATDKDSVDKCLDIIHKQISRLADTPMSSRALSMAKKQYLGQLYIAMDHNEGCMFSAAKSYLVYNSVENMHKVQERIMSITAEELMDVAGEIYGNNTSLLIYK